MFNGEVRTMLSKTESEFRRSSQRRRASSFLLLTLLVPTTALAQAIQLFDNIPGSFVDISGSKPLVIGADDEIEITTFFGNFVFPSGIMVVANNGGVSFQNPPSNDLAPLNAPLPSAAAFGGGQSVLAYWDDFDDKDGEVYFFEQDGRAIVQWHNRRLGANPASTARFQLQILQDPGPAGLVAQLVFSHIEQTGVEGGSSATIGYQDGGAGFGNAQWSFDTPGAVSNSTVLSLVVADTSPVPATSDWGLIVTALAVLAAGTLCIRKCLRLQHRA